jgi:hypothetical protein
MAICVISQPRFFPGLHYLHRMMVADFFVVLDNVQFNPRHEENRARVKGPNGPQWITVPVRQSSREQLIRDTRVDPTQHWQRKLSGTIRALYARAPHFADYSEEILEIIRRPLGTLLAVDLASWEPALRLLGINCRILLASELPVGGTGSRLLLEICQHLGVDIYLSGPFGRDYLDVGEFNAAGVRVCFHEYVYPLYPQRFGEFVPFLSYLDTLFNAGLDREMVAAGGCITGLVA